MYSTYWTIIVGYLLTEVFNKALSQICITLNGAQCQHLGQIDIILKVLLLIECCLSESSYYNWYESNKLPAQSNIKSYQGRKLMVTLSLLLSTSFQV